MALKWIHPLRHVIFSFDKKKQKKKLQIILQYLTIGRNETEKIMSFSIIQSLIYSLSFIIIFYYSSSRQNYLIYIFTSLSSNVTQRARMYVQIL